MSDRSSCVGCFVGRPCSRHQPPADAGERPPRKRPPNWPALPARPGDKRGVLLTRYAAEAARDEVCIGYATEEQLYGPLLTFRDWLVDTSGERRDAC